jgi:hypothetical protein
MISIVNYLFEAKTKTNDIDLKHSMAIGGAAGLGGVLHQLSKEQNRQDIIDNPAVLAIPASMVGLGVAGGAAAHGIHKLYKMYKNKRQNK